MHISSRFRIGFTSIVALSLCAIAKAAPPTVGFTAIAVRNNVGTNTERTAGESDGSPSRAIDGNFATATYLTTANTSTAFSPQHTYLDLGSATPVYGFRWSKTDGYVDPHTLAFYISAGSGAVTGRTFSPVSNISDGYFGTELMGGIFSGNTITNDNNGAGVYSVMFEGGVGATAIRFDFSSAGSFDHYHVNEFQAIVPEPAGLAVLLGVFGLLPRRKLT